MNKIIRNPLSNIGYGFIAPEYLPKGKNEYHLRNRQNRNGTEYRQLSAVEIEMLVRNNNTSDNWNKILVSDAFNPSLVKNCKFYGLVRIGKLEPYFLEFHNLRMPVGLYNSTIISCDLGDNVVIDNVNYLSHYILGNDVMIVNVNELATTSVAKFGNGIVKQGEPENIRIWLEVCNENAGRKIIPFNGMLPGDAFMWAKFRNDEQMLNRFLAFTEKQFDKQRGYYGKIGDRTVIKNSRIIKDVWMGTDVYIKGANKLKNLTINSSAEATTQIGEGCELVNGIVGEGCKLFYGVKAVRFFMASHSQLKYGARLINSYLGDNSTISCCEVLNSLIFPFHEQHHNNSFLCAALIQGQSNMAAGATIGSNHNSRSADGELQAGRGFWPGLCVSLKHNSKFASFTIISKGDFPAELNIKLPFSLVSNDVAHDRLLIMPAYWFMHNLYALTRNEWKYGSRDSRKTRHQHLETSYLAPDSINEMFEAMELLAGFTGRAANPGEKDFTKCIKTGKDLLNRKDPLVEQLEILAEGFENTDRKVVLLKVQKAYDMYISMIRFYGIQHLIKKLDQPNPKSVLAALPARSQRKNWISLGGQLIPEAAFSNFREAIHKDKIKDWDGVHQFYLKQTEAYPEQVFQHAYASLLEISGSKSRPNFEVVSFWLKEGIHTFTWINEGIIASRKKDYENPFRQMVYEDEKEMDKVVGSLEDNGFIQHKKEELINFSKQVKKILSRLK